MKFDSTKHGRGSRETGNPTVRRDWERAAAQGPEWVPAETIWVRDDVEPRLESHTDDATVERYADNYAALPPIVVQRDTFALVDGRHRLAASYKASTDFIRITEVDVADDELIDWAVRANANHGRGANQAERIHWAKDFLERHSDWSDGRIAEWTGASVRFVFDERARQSRQIQNSAGTGDQPMHGAYVEAPLKRLGADGKWRAVPPRATKIVQSYDPGPDRDHDDDEYELDYGTPEEEDEEEAAPVSTLVAERTLANGETINILTGEITLAKSQLAHDTDAFCQALNLIMSIQSPSREIWFSLDDRERHTVAEIIAVCEARIVEVWRLCPVATTSKDGEA